MALQGFGFHYTERVGYEVIPLFLRYTGCKKVGVKRRFAYRCEYPAVLRIYCDYGPDLILHCRVCCQLSVQVYGKVDIIPWQRCNFFNEPYLPSKGIHLYLPPAVIAAQICFPLVFHAVLPDKIPRHVIGPSQLFYLLFIYLSEVADNVGGGVSEGIYAPRSYLKPDARHVQSECLNLGYLLPCQIFFQFYELKWGASL